MSKVSSFGFTNTSDSTNSVTAKALGLVTNYALMQDAADVVKMNNKTAPLDSEEIISFRTRDVAGVASEAPILNPAKVGKGIEYSIRVDEILSTTDSTDASFRVDEPIVATLAVRHPKSGNITDQHVQAVIIRLLSTLIKADGTWRIADLMRSAERPIVD